MRGLGGVRRRSFVRFATTAGLAASLTAWPSSAGATVTIGQLAPETPPPGRCNSPIAFDVLQRTVSSGNPFTVPSTIVTGTLTSWSHNASMDAGQALSMKVFRKVGDPSTYRVIGHDGPRTIAPSMLNSFGGLSIPVKSGDVLGLHEGATPTACAFAVPGETGLRSREGDLADGEQGTFIASDPDRRLNITAVVDPTNAFSLGEITRNKKKGNATITATVPNPGELTAWGDGVKAAGARNSVAVAAPGNVPLLIKARGKKKKKLNRRGKVKLEPIITYTPSGGTAAIRSTKLKLKKNL